MPEKGNGLDRTNHLLEQLLQLAREHNERLGSVDERLGRVEERLTTIESAVRQIASFVGQEFQDLKRRVEVLEQKIA